jgi:FtsZ-binding cell division protein ZapB
MSKLIDLHEACRKDTEVLKDKISSLEEDNYYLAQRNSNLDGEIETLSAENDTLTNNAAELSEYIQDLETALAEAHLMSVEDKPEV